MSDTDDCPTCGFDVCDCPDDDYDPSPWCTGCGSMTKAGCDCGPMLVPGAPR